MPPEINTPSQVAVDIPWSAEPPTKPGTYWFNPEPPSRAIMEDVRVTDGELMVLWPQIDAPELWGTVAEAYGSVLLPQYLRKGAMVSIGIGKIVVEFFSAAISTRVCR